MNQAIVYNAQTKEWLKFEHPHQVIQANCLEDVISQLELVNQIIETQKFYAVGFISYEASPAFDSALVTHNPSSFPLLWFGLYEQVEVIELPTIAANLDYHLDWKPSVNRQEYEQAIAQIKHYIAQGETYQVNYTMRLNASFSGEAWELFLRLVQAQQADYAAYIELERYTICSAAPELFFHLHRHQLTTKPMKGTAKRGYTLEQDCMLAKQLENCPKNRAENLMIVDMLRNDLGRIANWNSVQVPSLFDVESYPTLWQMTSTVTATINASLTEIMKALFPCASITGAPKRRTMEIIRSLETTPRNLYTGTIGFITPQRQAQFNVAIRTVIIDRQTNQAEYGVGSGIVWDSVTGDEYRECQLKAKVLTTNRLNFSLLETLLWTPEEGYFLLDYHWQRLKDSALYFGFLLNLEQINTKLKVLANSLSCQPHKVRLLVSQKGEISYSAMAISPTTKKSLKLGIAATPISTKNPFLYHKTTNRQTYDCALAAAPDCDDVLLWNERGEITETCLGNIVVQLNDKLLTPPVECGLLAGTFRNYLLDQGKIEEEILPLDILQECESIYRINSVRKWCNLNHNY